MHGDQPVTRAVLPTNSLSLTIVLPQSNRATVQITLIIDPQLSWLLDSSSQKNILDSISIGIASSIADNIKPSGDILWSPNSYNFHGAKKSLQTLCTAVPLQPTNNAAKHSNHQPHPRYIEFFFLTKSEQRRHICATPARQFLKSLIPCDNVSMFGERKFLIAVKMHRRRYCNIGNSRLIPAEPRLTGQTCIQNAG